VSYILDALKRSEQERHQGELAHATIDTIMLKSKPVKHQWWPYLLIVVLVLNICVYVYFQFSKEELAGDLNGERESKKSLVNHEVAESVNSSIKQSNAPVQNPPANNSENNTESQMVKPLPAHIQQTPRLNKYYDLNQLNASAEAKQLNSNQSRNTHNPAKASSKPEFNEEGFEVIRPKQIAPAKPSNMPEIVQNKQNVADAHRLKNQQVKVSPQINTISSASDIPENYELIQPTRNIPAASQSPVQSSEAAPVTKGVDRFENILHLNDLAPAFQKTVPDIRFNSHIYSDRPAERRVIINDLYLKEGQGFSGLTIVTIGEFYIELEKQGQSFKLPVLRDWFRPN